MNYKVIAAFVAGAAFGGLLGVYLTREKYEKESREAIDSVKAHYKKLDEIRVEKERLSKEADDKLADLKMSERKQIEEYNEISNRYYADQNEEMEQLSPVEHPDKPYVIKEEDYIVGNSHYTKETVYWYDLDEILVDEDHDILVDPASLIGWDFQDEIEMEKDEGTFDGIIYIRNDRISRDFEVYIEEGPFPTDDYGDD